MDGNLAMALQEDILHLRKTKLWEHLVSQGSHRQECLIEELVRCALASTDMRVRVVAQHYVVSKETWGEIASIERQAEEVLSQHKPSEGMRSEFEYDSP